MSAPVNVLEVLDLARALALYDHTQRDFGNARAAVAELIDKADTAATLLSNLIAARQVDDRYSGHVTDLTAALARVQGGAE
jgi:hypothetical protein